jgi:hypothetical protein
MHARIVEFEVLIIGDEEKGFGSEVDDMTLAAQSGARISAFAPRRS